MRDDEEIGAEHDTFNSDQPDRDRETSQGARRLPAEGTPGAPRSKPRGEDRDRPARRPAD